MMQHLLLAILLFLAGTIGVNNDSSAKGDKPPFKIMMKRDTDKVKVMTIHASVSSHEDELKYRCWKDGKENLPLDAKSVYWIKLRRFDDGVDAASRSKDRCFEIALPKSFFEEEPKSMKISWIDFYR